MYSNLLEKLSKPPATSEKDESILLEPYTYITSNPGKEIRGRMIEGFNLWLNVPPEELAIIARLVSMLHSASLLIDDIEDDSQLRRGQPVAHKIYGIPQTINSGNYVYFLAYNQLLVLRELRQKSTQLSQSLELEKIVTEEMLNLHRGQGLELFWRDSLTCPTEDEYISMVNNKTGGLFRLGVKLMMACATTNREINYVPLVNLIGVFFQIRDDYFNLKSSEYEANKGYAEDLTEGKFSFPIVHGVRADTTNRQLLNVLQKRPTTPTLKKHAINYLGRVTNSFDYTLKVLLTLEAQLRLEINRLGGNRVLEDIMDSLSVRP